MSNATTHTTATAPTAGIVWRIPDASAVAAGTADRMLHAAAIARGDVGFYVRSASLAWGRKQVRSLTSEDTGEVWSAASIKDGVPRVAFKAVYCRNARRALEAVAKHAPQGLSDATAESLALAVMETASTGGKGTGVTSPRVVALISKANVAGLQALKAEATASKSKAAKAAKADATDSPEADSPEAPEADSPEATVVTVPAPAAARDAVAEAVSALEYLRTVGVSQEDADMLATLVLALPVQQDA